MTRMPLHLQILAALILGTLIGLAANPGEVDLPDTSVEATLTAAPVNGGERILVTLDDPGDQENMREIVADETALKSQYPNLAQAWQQNSPREAVEISATVPVTRRRVHITQNPGGISLSYARQHAGRSVVTTVKAADAAGLQAEHPQWAEVYSTRGGGSASPLPTRLRYQVMIWSKFVGDVFLRLLKMITVPLIVTSLVTGVAGLGNTSRLGKMFSRTLIYYLCTSLLAITVGLLLVNLIQPGVGAQLPGGGEGALAGGEQSLGSVFTGLIDNLIPPNPVQALANGDFLSIISFSILLGIFIILTGGKSGETLREFFQAAFDVMMGMTMFIIRLAPIGVLAFMIYATASQGIEVFRTLAWYMLTVFLGLVVHAFVILPLIVKFIARRSPWEFFRAMSPAMMTAFSTASSNGTLPLTITCVEERAGVSNRVSSFVLPLGATINMDGTALYEAVAVLFIAQATATANPDFTLTLGAQITVALTALLASVGAAGIPHAGLVMMAIVMQAVGLPLEAQGIIIVVDRVLDMCRTSVNVWSDSCGCAVLDRFETAPAAEPTPQPAEATS